MLTKVTIRNFKNLNEVEIELGKTVVFIGPNNSGKTTALQTLALWDAGIKRWMEKRSGEKIPEKRSGVTINRRDLIAVPVPSAKLLWKDLHVRDVSRIAGKQKTSNILINVIVEGFSEGKKWRCGLEFDYANEESFYCRPLRLNEDKKHGRMVVPEAVKDLRFAYLQPMSGLAANEIRLETGAINVRLGEGRTAEVLRNLCYQVVEGEDGKNRWENLCGRIRSLFGISLERPEYIAERGEIAMTYQTPGKIKLDLSCVGRGLQQTLLLFAFMAANSKSVLLLDEPDAHLEILRQREIYQTLTDIAIEQDNQLIIASHSEIVLEEAVGRDVVVAFLGKPHRIDDRGSQVMKSLRDIGFDQYMQAGRKGWVLYLEGSTDLEILRAFARKLNHPARKALELAFVHYVQNLPWKVESHFHGLREACSDLAGFALFDRLDKRPAFSKELHVHVWRKREIENYLCQPETLLAYAREAGDGQKSQSLVNFAYQETMQECIEYIVPKMALQNMEDEWWIKTKTSDDFLKRLFEEYSKKLELPNVIRKSGYYILADYVPSHLIDDEISKVLDKIAETAALAKPMESADEFSQIP